MSYEHGDLQLWLPGEKGSYEQPSTDARRDDGYDESGAPKPPCAYLPHSCDQWVIGGPEEVREMIADLQAALERMRA